MCATRVARSSPRRATRSGSSAASSIGMAVTIAALALLNATMVLPFPRITEQHRLVRVSVSRSCGRPNCWIRMSSPSDVAALEEGLTGLQGLAGYTAGEIPVALPDARSMRGIIASANYFEVLGVRPHAWPRLRRARCWHERRGRRPRPQRLATGVRSRSVGDRPIDPRRRRVRAHRRRGARALHRHRSHQTGRSCSGYLAADVARGPRARRSRRPNRAGRNGTSRWSAGCVRHLPFRRFRRKPTFWRGG